MSYAHHPHFLTQEWFSLHPQFLVAIKRYGPAFGGIVAVLAAALLVWTIHSAMDTPIQTEASVTSLADELFVATGLSGYIPPQYLVPELQAPSR